MATILIINPNSTLEMTEAVRRTVQNLHNGDSEYEYFTAKTGPASINNDEDAHSSASACMPDLLPLLPIYSGFLVACYSDHPLVQELAKHTSKPVLGICQASLAASLISISPSQTFGIISTGKIWEDLLSKAVRTFIGGESIRFSGVETTGLSAIELHQCPAETVEQKLKEATIRLLSKSDGNCGAICLGCAGMVGMEETVRRACMEYLGEMKGKNVKIICGIRSGVGMLHALMNC